MASCSILTARLPLLPAEVILQSFEHLKNYPIYYFLPIAQLSSDWNRYAQKYIYHSIELNPSNVQQFIKTIQEEESTILADSVREIAYYNTRRDKLDKEEIQEILGLCEKVESLTVHTMDVMRIKISLCMFGPCPNLKRLVVKGCSLRLYDEEFGDCDEEEEDELQESVDLPQLQTLVLSLQNQNAFISTNSPGLPRLTRLEIPMPLDDGFASLMRGMAEEDEIHVNEEESFLANISTLVVTLIEPHIFLNLLPHLPKLDHLITSCISDLLEIPDLSFPKLKQISLQIMDICEVGAYGLESAFIQEIQKVSESIQKLKSEGELSNLKVVKLLNLSKVGKNKAEAKEYTEKMYCGLKAILISFGIELQLDSSIELIDKVPGSQGQVRGITQ